MRSTLPVDAVELRASGQAPAPGSGHRLRSQSLALLVAAALQDEAAGLPLHALAEAVGASPLALLGLIRALHAVRESSQRTGAEPDHGAEAGLAVQSAEFPRSLQGCPPRVDTGPSEQLYARASS